MKDNNIIRAERNLMIGSIPWAEYGIDLIKMTPFQYRFQKGNKKVDYYITSSKYFIINTQKWGSIAVNDIPSLLVCDNEHDENDPRTSNLIEQLVIDKYTKKGYSCLKRGYPDFCFYNDNEVFFIEVKKEGEERLKSRGLNKYQVKMIDIFKRLGLSVKVEYVSKDIKH